MFRFYDVLAGMAEGLLAAYNGFENPHFSEDESQPGWKKNPLHVPYGQDFATWREVERRRMMESENAAIGEPVVIH